MNNLKEKFINDKNRYVTAIVLISGLIILLLINNQILVWLTLGILFIIGFKESLAFYGIEQNLKLYGFAVLVWILAFFNSRPIEAGIVACMILAGYLAYTQKLDSKKILPFIYPTIPFLAIYSVYIDFQTQGLVWLILIVALCDIGAYFGGKAIGKTPLTLTSPKKTLEGAIIGLGLAVIVGSVVGIWALSVNFAISILLSVLVGVASIFGDLYESYLKRKANLKDSGSILPGHGGILDRLDALFFGAIALHFLLYFFEKWQSIQDSSIIPDIINSAL